MLRCAEDTTHALARTPVSEHVISCNVCVRRLTDGADEVLRGACLLEDVLAAGCGLCNCYGTQLAAYQRPLIQR